VRNEGAPGDYGIAYGAKVKLVNAIVRQHPDRDVEVDSVLELGNPASAAEYRFLIWNSAPKRRVDDSRPLHYEVVFSKKPLPRSLATEAAIRNLPWVQVGPLAAVAVPAR